MKNNFFSQIKKSFVTLGFATLLSLQGLSQEKTTKIQSTIKTDSLLIDYFLPKKIEKQVLVIGDSIINFTAYSSIRESIADTALLFKTLKENDTILHSHNHIENIYLHAVWYDKKKTKKAFKRFSKKTLENRLLSNVPSVKDVVYLLNIEYDALENNKNYTYNIVVIKNEKAKFYNYGLTQEVKDSFKLLSKEKRVDYWDNLYWEYKKLNKKYHTKHCYLWDTKKCKEPSNKELIDLINKQKIIFIHENGR